MGQVGHVASTYQTYPTHLAYLALAALLASTGCIDLVGAHGARHVERETKLFTTSGPPELNLTTFDGAIEVRAWDRPEVEVIVEKHAVTPEAAATIEVQTRQSGNQVTVEARVPRSTGFGIHFHYSRSAKLIVSAPAASSLVARSGDGSITVEALSGRVDLGSGDGSIRGRDLGGDVKARTGDGSVRFDGVTGGLDVDTGDGSVVLTGKLTRVRARTGDGSVAISADSGSNPSGDWDIVTGDGAVTLELADAFNAELDAHTGDGRIRMTDITLSNVNGDVERNRVRGQIGSGGRLLRVRTGGGSITVRRS